MEDFAKIIEKIEEEIKLLFFSDSSGHDIYHLKRTMNISLHIHEKEGGDKLIIAVASLLHDVHRIIQDETGKYCSPEDSLPKVKEILEKVGLAEKEKVDKILNCVKVHEEYDFSDGGKTSKDIESLVVQDADNLEAMGAIGIARVFAYGGAHNIPIWVPEVPLPKGNWNDSSPKSVSQIHHFYEKLLRLKDDMNTKTGKELSKVRHKILEDFLENFFKEWEGKV